MPPFHERMACWPEAGRQPAPARLHRFRTDDLGWGCWQMIGAATRIGVLGPVAEIVLHPPLHRTEKEKLRYLLDSGVFFTDLVPER